MPEKVNAKASSEFVIERTFDAPRDLVFEMWTDAKHIANWLAPGGMKTVYKKSDIKIGATVHYYMETPGGKMWGKATYREIQRPSRIVYEQSFSDENEGITSHPMMPTWPKEMLTTVQFDAVGDKTKVKVTWIAINASSEEVETFEKAKPGMAQGWGGSLDQLQAYISRQVNRT